MAKHVNAVFLEDWLKGISGYDSSNTFSSKNSIASSARGIIQSWAELRDSLKNESFHSHHLQALKSLVSSQTLLHVADPQAKLVLSIISSPKLSLPHESYPLLLRLLYIWVRKSTRPSSALIDSAVEIISHNLSALFDHNNIPFVFSEAVLHLGSLAFVRSVSESSKRVCLELLCRLLEEKYALMGSFEGIVPDVLAGIGYALSSSLSFHYVRPLAFLLGVWGEVNGPRGSLSHGLMILHLVEFVMSHLFDFRSLDNATVFSREALEATKEKYVPFTVVMAAAGVLRALNKSAASGQGMDILSRLRISAEDRIESVARSLISVTSDFANSGKDLTVSLCLQCLSLALARCGPVSPRSPFFVCLATALLTEIFPLRQFYAKVLESLHVNSAGLLHKELKQHLESVPVKEAGAITSVLCNQYVSADEESQNIVENLMWNYCHRIYVEHRKDFAQIRKMMEEQRRFLAASEIAKSSMVEVREPTSAFEWGIAAEQRQKPSTEETQPVLSVDFEASCGVMAESGVYGTRFHDSGPIGSYLHVIRVGVSNSGGIGSDFGELGTASRDLRSGSLNSRVGLGIFRVNSNKGWAGLRNSGRIWIGCRDSGTIGADFCAIGNGPPSTSVFGAGIGNLGVSSGEIRAVYWSACLDRATLARLGLDFLIPARLRVILVQLDFTLEISASLGQGMHKLVCLEFKLGSSQMADLKLVGLQLQNPTFIWFTALGPIVVGIVATKFMVPSLSVVAFITVELDSPSVNAPFDVLRFKLINMGRKWSHSAAIS